MSTAAWILIVATHVSGGTQVQFQDFNDQPSCTAAAQATKSMANIAGGDAAVKCVPKGGVL